VKNCGDSLLTPLPDFSKLSLICTGYRKPVRIGRGRAAVIGYEPPYAISRKGEKAEARLSRKPEDGPDAICGTPSRQRSKSLLSGCFRSFFRSRG